MRTLLTGWTLLLAAALTGGGLVAGTLQEERWDRARLVPAKLYAARRIVDRIEANRHRYEGVSQSSGVPWFVVAALHNMESGGSFHHHLYEGSSLRGRTRYVPKGRPKLGDPPFTWEYSAIDALAYDRMGGVRWTHLDDLLYACERYNGTGYLRFRPTVPTPYLWAGTSIEVPGKYIADGKWSSTARSGQIGCAAVWRHMEAAGIINLNLLQRK